MKRYQLLFFATLFGFFVYTHLVFAGTVLSSYKYAWSNMIGYINFENVVVSDSGLSGYAWSSTKGWIKFNPAAGGVSNDGTGNLSGSAWGERLGWIDFDGVSISRTTGRFSGTASGTLVGTITFNCPTYCDVRTDWGQATTTASSTSSASSGSNAGGGNGAPSQNVPDSSVATPSHLAVNGGFFLIAPEQSGVLTKIVPAGSVVLEVPVGAISSKATFTIAYEPLSVFNRSLLVGDTTLVDSVFYTVSAIDERGVDIHSFLRPITIRLPIPSSISQFDDLGVYWLNEVNHQWVLIPDAVFSHGVATFSVNHLTTFAIFRTSLQQQKLKNLPLVPSLFSQNILLSKDEALFDVVSEPIKALVAPGELLPISVKLSNFGAGRRVDVSITYSITDATGKEVYTTNETVAVETTADFVKTIQIPPGLVSGSYIAKTSISYPGQHVPAITEFPFTVEKKFFGLFQSELYVYGVVGLMLCILASFIFYWLFQYNRRPHRDHII